MDSLCDPHPVMSLLLNVNELLFLFYGLSVCKRFLVFKLYLPPANEVCEGYVFTPVCQSFCSQRGCMAGGACVAGGMCGRGACVAGGCAWARVCVHDREVCMAGCVCVGRGACMGRGDVHGRGACMPHTPPRHYKIRSVNAQAVCILLECILVLFSNYTMPLLQRVIEFINKYAFQ